MTDNNSDDIYKSNDLDTKRKKTSYRLRRPTLSTILSQPYGWRQKTGFLLLRLGGWLVYMGTEPYQRTTRTEETITTLR